MNIDPWGSSPIEEEDYDRIKREFGIEEISESLRQKLIKNRFIRRKIIFGASLGGDYRPPSAPFSWVT